MKAGDVNYRSALTPLLGKDSAREVRNLLGVMANLVIGESEAPGLPTKMPDDERSTPRSRPGGRPDVAKGSKNMYFNISRPKKPNAALTPSI